MNSSRANQKIRNEDPADCHSKPLTLYSCLSLHDGLGFIRSSPSASRYVLHFPIHLYQSLTNPSNPPFLPPTPAGVIWIRKRTPGAAPSFRELLFSFHPIPMTWSDIMPRKRVLSAAEPNHHTYHIRGRKGLAWIGIVISLIYIPMFG